MDEEAEKMKSVFERKWERSVMGRRDGDEYSS
jgi:hypothetical protein